jgi:hypothetical protein
MNAPYGGGDVTLQVRSEICRQLAINVPSGS